MSIPLHKKTGLSLVETLVYASILALIFGVVVTSMVELSRSYKTLKVHRSMNLSSISGMERMIREIRQATNVVQTQSVFSTSPGKLVLVTTLPDASTTTTEFYLATTTLMMKQGGVVLGALTTASASVDSLIFRLIQNGNVSKAIKVEMQITATDSGYSKTAKLYTSAILRGSYQ